MSDKKPGKAELERALVVKRDVDSLRAYLRSFSVDLDAVCREVCRRASRRLRRR